ncbi:EAL domain-containing protein [Motiliproteus sp. SC1-56]|uniref:bifunctional diguanylate cyclase/phosphodiesterase n=1 Tax=Motiliproteus sp. SC1-56 TaxID=2799565 RepID=UPI001A8D4B2D|nr:EAL domain-containing protein [Motiliproteus sp. SC1-56]
MKPSYRYWLAPLTFILVLSAALSWSWAQESAWRSEQQRHLNEVAQSVATSIERHLSHAASAAYILGSLVRHNDGALENFAGHARDILTSVDGISNLQLAPAGIIDQIYPLPGHEAALGHNILRDDQRRNEAWVALNSKRMTLAGPFTLRQGGEGLIVRQPVFLPKPDGAEQFWGFASALVLVDDLLAATELPSLEARGLRYTLARPASSSDEMLRFAGAPQEALENPVQVQIPVPNQHWLLEVAASSPLASAPYFAIQVFFSFVVALSCALLIYALLRQPDLLKQRVAHKTRESRHLQQALEQERSRAERYLDMANAMLLVLDAEGRVVMLNQRGHQILGHPPGSLIGQSWPQRCLPETEREAVHSHLSECLAAGLTEDYYENHVVTAEGDTRLIAWHNVVAWDAERNAPQLICAGQDITAQRRDQATLHTLSCAVEQSSACVMILDRQGRIEYVNPYFTRLTGFESDEVRGKKPRFLESEDTSRSDLIALRRRISRGREWHGEICYQKKNRELFWARETISPIKNNQGVVTHFVSVSEDITRLRLHQEQIERLAYWDQLTGLANRRLFRKELAQALSERHGRRQHLTLFYLNLDQFKRVNDSLGHEAGDELLRLVADKLRQELGSDSLLGRLGGDEFAFALADIDEEAAARLAGRISALVRKPTRLSAGISRAQEMFVTTSIGIAVAPGDSQDAAELMKFADMAMHQAKKHGRNTHRFFSPALTERAEANLFLEQELRQAIRNREFVLFYQPQIDLKSGEVVGLEALVRWQHPRRGMIFPNHFIPLAEETGLIVGIGQQVIMMACEAYQRLQTLGLGQLRVAVNLSALQFHDPLFISTFKHILDESRVPAAQIELELTESMLMENVEEAIKILKQLKTLGATLAIDDFGTGYSSLSYLKRLPVDILKVDRTFVKDIPQDQNDMEITAAVIAMAHKLKLEVVGEGVETDEQERFLRDNGCELAQGYLYSPPVPEGQLVALVTRLNQRAKRNQSRVIPLEQP